MEAINSYEPIKVKRLLPIKDHILVTDMNFDMRTTSNGIVLLSDNAKSEGIRPRWGKIYAVGPEQKELQVGQWILVAHGRWTRGTKIDDGQGVKTVRRVSNDDVMLVSDEMPNDDTMSDAVTVVDKSKR